MDRQFMSEYGQLTDVFGKGTMTYLFNDLQGYISAREECTFYEIRDELVNFNQYS